MKNSSKMMFLMMMMFSTLMIISSSSWMNAWMGLEINLISFISYMLNNNKSNSIEASIIYFLIQSLASILFLFSLIMFFKMTNLSFILINFFNSLMLCALLMKMGAAPLHFWLPIIMQSMSWMNNYILTTWQKLGPLILIISSYTYYFHQFIMLSFIIISMMVGALGGFNQTALKKIMAFSSINQISWLLIASILSKYLWLIYFLFYFFVLMNTLMIFNSLNIIFLPQLMNLKMNNYNSLFIFFSIMSMGGLPPFLGFFPKMFIILNLNNTFLMIMLIMFTLITLFYYLRIMYSILFLNHLKKNMIKFKPLNNMIMKLSLISNTFLMIIILF